MQDNVPTVCILMCTYNGAEYLEEQLDSFVSQTMNDWSLVVSDDGSSDESLDICKAFQEKTKTCIMWQSLKDLGKDLQQISCQYA